MQLNLFQLVPKANFWKKIQYNFLYENNKELFYKYCIYKYIYN